MNADEPLVSHGDFIRRHPGAAAGVESLTRCTIISARNMDDAEQIAKGCPMIKFVRRYEMAASARRLRTGEGTVRRLKVSRWLAAVTAIAPGCLGIQKVGRERTVSRVLYPFPGGDHLSWTPIARRLQRPLPES